MFCSAGLFVSINSDHDISFVCVLFLRFVGFMLGIAESYRWSDSDSDMDTKWTFAASALYALTVITSTGYDHLTPSTNAGRIFTVFYGLLGIPLMFITAADIGKFLSDLVSGLITF
jgi:hypothetical protein